SGRQSDADLGVFLEAADARAVAGARVDDHERPLLVVDLYARGRNDAHQRVIRRPLVGPRIRDRFVFVLEHRRLARGLVRKPLVAPLAQRVPVQHRALRGVERVFRPLPPEFEWGLRRGSARRPLRIRSADAVDKALVGGMDAPLQQIADRAGDPDRTVDGAVKVRHTLSSLREARDCAVQYSTPAQRAAKDWGGYSPSQAMVEVSSSGLGATKPL